MKVSQKHNSNPINTTNNQEIKTSTLAMRKKADYTIKINHNSKQSFSNSFIKRPLTATNHKYNKTAYDKLNESCISKVSKEVFDLDKVTIIELLNVMTKYEKKCNLEGNFVEAGLIKERIERLRKIEELKVLDEIQTSHEYSKEMLMDEQKRELEAFNEYYDDSFNKVNLEYKLKKSQMDEKHKEEVERKKREIEGYYPEHPKPSALIINKNDTLRNLQKQRK